MKQQKKRKQWIYPRHRLVRDLACLVLAPYSYFKFGVKIKRFTEQGNRQYLIVMNHQTTFDQFFVGLAFRGPIYYIATEDIFSLGWVSKLLRYVVAPIPIKKQTTDLQAVKNCIQVVKEGGTIALAPEGNRTYSGKTEYIKPSIVKLVRALKLPLAIFRIEGGYGVHPRWSDTVRRGKMRAYVARVIEPEEYKNMTNDELFAIIKQVLTVDEREDKTLFHGKRLAEFLDRVVYVCPDCGLSVFRSEGDIISCTKCGKQIRYLPNKELEGINCSFPYRYVKEWYDAQNEFIRNLDLTSYENVPLYKDTVSYQESIYCKHKRMIDAQAKLSVFANRFEIDTQNEKIIFLFKDMSGATVLGKNKLNLYIDGKTYQIAGDKHFNAVKYLNVYHHGINNQSDEPEFLGL